MKIYVPQKKAPKKHIASGNRVITMSDVSYEFLKYAVDLSCENYLSSDGWKKAGEAWGQLRLWQHNNLIRDVFKVTGVPNGKEKPVKTAIENDRAVHQAD